MSHPPQSADRDESFVRFLEELAGRDDRAALAALRRGLGKPPGSAAEMHRYVVPWLGQHSPPWQDDCLYMVAALFAHHPANWQAADESELRNFGASFAVLQRKPDSSESVEKRFVALLNCHRDELFPHLRHAVSILKSKEVRVDWLRLLKDIRSWDSESRYVQRAWSKAFWASGGPASTQQQQTEHNQTDDESGNNN